jgi:hypothetical protein
MKYGYMTIPWCKEKETSGIAVIEETCLWRSGQVCFRNKCRKLVYFVTIFTFSCVSHSNLQIVGEFFSKIYSDSPESAFYGLIDCVSSKFSDVTILHMTLCRKNLDYHIRDCDR